MRVRVPVQRGVGRSEPLSPENLVNAFVSQSPDQGATQSSAGGARSPMWIEGIPGLALKTTLNSFSVRGMWQMAGLLYVVAGSTLFSVDSSFAATNRGAIDGSGRVSMADNGDQLCIVNGDKGFIYTVASGLSQITDPDFPGADTVAYLDGYFIFNNPGTGQFFISDLDDGTMYDASDFATAESFPDPLLAVFVDHRELFLFGSDTVEVWFNSGAADFPFTRATGASIEKGISAPFSVAKIDNSVLWLDNQGVVRRIGEGYVPIRVSTHAVETQIVKGDWQNATAYSYFQEGHEFYALTVANAGTFVYDAATDTWHDRQSFGRVEHRVGFHEFIYDTHVVGDIITGKIYELDFDVEDEAGDPIIAEMIYPQVKAQDSNRFIVDFLELDMEVGTGITTGQGSDPEIMLQTSRDGGRTYGNNEIILDLGAVGEFENRAKHWRLGQFRSFTPRIRISDPVQRAAYTMYVGIRQGVS